MSELEATSQSAPRKIAAYLPYPVPMPANELRQIELIRECLTKLNPHR